MRWDQHDLEVGVVANARRDSHGGPPNGGCSGPSIEAATCGGPHLLLVVLALGGAATAWASSRASVPSPTIGPEGVLVDNVANLAPSPTTLAGQSVDAITRQSQFEEVVNYRIHVHLVIDADGQMVRLLAGIGITPPSLVEKLRGGDFCDAGTKDGVYWLHTHVAGGIIHVESPVKEGFTLGQFFDVWNQPSSATRVGGTGSGRGVRERSVRAGRTSARSTAVPG